MDEAFKTKDRTLKSYCSTLMELNCYKLLSSLERSQLQLHSLSQEISRLVQLSVRAKELVSIRLVSVCVIQIGTLVIVLVVRVISG